MCVCVCVTFECHFANCGKGLPSGWEGVLRVMIFDI